MGAEEMENIEEESSISSFEKSMFVENPIRWMKFWEFLSNIDELSDLRVKLFKVSKESYFSSIVDEYENMNSKKNSNSGLLNLQKNINNYNDELKSDVSIKFSTNEIEEINEALLKTFKISAINKILYWVNVLTDKIIFNKYI